MSQHPRLIRPLAALAAASLTAGVLTLSGPTSTALVAPAQTSAAQAAKAAKPTIVLVHGAFADSSGWAAVSDRLTELGYPVVVFSNPLRNPIADGEYLRQFLTTISGDIVLVGHSYGGAVITNAATDNPHVTDLVYVAAYALDEGESVAAANSLGGGHATVTDHLVVRPYPGAPEGDGDAYIDPAWFHRLFAQDLPRSTTRFMALSQRPGALSGLITPSGEPAWKTIPSWYVIASKDRIIPPQAERAMAKRAGAKTIVLDSSHVAMMSRPKAVTKIILRAAR